MTLQLQSMFTPNFPHFWSRSLDGGIPEFKLAVVPAVVGFVERSTEEVQRNNAVTNCHYL